MRQIHIHRNKGMIDRLLDYIFTLGRSEQLRKRLIWSPNQVLYFQSK